MLELLVIVLLVGGLLMFVLPRIRGRRGPGGQGVGANLAHGTLLVTGVSAGADSDGSQTVTITGVINGPTVNEHEVYTRMVMKVGESPSMGQLIPVVYSPKNPDKWGFAPPEVPGPPPPPPAPKTEIY